MLARSLEKKGTNLNEPGTEHLPKLAEPTSMLLACSGADLNYTYNSASYPKPIVNVDK